MGNVICEAKIKAKSSIIWKILFVLIVILIILIPIPVKEKLTNPSYNEKIGTYLYEPHDFDILGFEVDGYNGSFFTNFFNFSVYTSARKLFLFLSTILITMMIMWIANINMSQKSSLTLYDDKIDGQRSGISTKTLKLPIDKIDNIMLSEGIWNKLWSGKTVAVRSTSGLIKFPWVQNADEFVNATLAKIEEYKQQMKDDNKNLISAAMNNSANTSAAAKIKELKELLDSGIISQEDFEAKKQELLSKM